MHRGQPKGLPLSLEADLCLTPSSSINQTTLVALASVYGHTSFLDSSGTRHNLQDLLGHSSLSGSVVLKREVLLQVLGVIRRSLHGSHTGSKLRSHRLLESSEDLAVKVEREDGIENSKRILLEEELVGEVVRVWGSNFGSLHGRLGIFGGEFEDLVGSRLNTGGSERQHGLERRLRSNERNELGVDELNGIRLPSKELGKHQLSNVRGLAAGGFLSTLDLLHDLLRNSPVEVLGDLLAHSHQLIVKAGGLQLLQARLGSLNCVRVVATAQTAVTRDGNNKHLLHISDLQKGKVDVLGTDLLGQSSEDTLESLVERSGLEHSILCPSHLGGSHQAHSLSDLAGVLHRLNTVTNNIGLTIHHKATRRS
mmetsp:Transcript_2548/g.3433  ORF Transcript_2548/g.3433 Transcript_2548/m.3433 type:complete len:367 (-) Transcript_2548:234-1334(-)